MVEGAAAPSGRGCENLDLMDTSNGALGPVSKALHVPVPELNGQGSQSG